MITGFDLVRAAISVVGVTANERSVLMVLAVMANDQAQAWPPIAGATGLTTKCVLSERAVQRAIKQLCAVGHLSRLQRRHGVVYTVHPDPLLTPVTQSGVGETGDTETPDTEAARPVPQSPKLPRTTKPTKASPSSVKRAAKPLAFVPPSDIPEAEWEAFEAMRQRIKKPMTDEARKLAVGRLRKLAEAGWPPGDVLNHSTLNNYQGLFPPKDDLNGQRNHPRNGSGHHHPGGRTGAASDYVFDGMDGGRPS